ncbi:hypothetical protein AUW17_06020 [Tenacibaculum dicentrarchi]|nr:hypothetical protein AUW17_06020 [Tenacibaculum dicentrarchi]
MLKLGLKIRNNTTFKIIFIKTAFEYFKSCFFLVFLQRCYLLSNLKKTRINYFIINYRFFKNFLKQFPAFRTRSFLKKSKKELKQSLQSGLEICAKNKY